MFTLRMQYSLYCDCCHLVCDVCTLYLVVMLWLLYIAGAKVGVLGNCNFGSFLILLVLLFLILFLGVASC